jgi:DNA-binding GntR family transcriptional regulator
LAAAAGRASDRVYARLRSEIDAGKIEPGQRLLEVDVAARFGVSRTPVREALIRLAREGVLGKADRGFALPRDDRRTFMERIEARKLLDVQIARLAALAAAKDGAPPSLEASLKKADAAHQSARPQPFANAHYALRDAIRVLAGNRLLARCAELVDDSFRVGRERLYQVDDYRSLTLDADTALVRAIQSGDADAAEAVTLQFLTAIERLGRTDLWQ